MTVFFSPPFADFERKLDELLTVIRTIQERVPADSVLVLQSEKTALLGTLPDQQRWDERKYGRNHLLFWVKEAVEEG